ncbi:hypothetical protein PPYR_11346 [Photinus pyralis]|uniref:Osiris 9 n=2 Tax=Photinus pyralis TaxID=7054 RepID=A0A5N4AB15_PHOPY|nr:uncharacterized protein LOC116177121 [Photinus pyralis]KAB0794507.1 hypothetical protein PPYR_11346 [Photinus pyralis]
MKSVALVFLFVLGALADDVKNEFEQGAMRDAFQFVDKCGNKEISVCLKERALQYLDKLPNRLEIGAGLSIEQAEGAVDRSGRVYNDRELPEDPRAREEAIDTMLYDKFLNFLSSHTVEFKVPDSAITEFKRSLEEGRKKKGKKGNMMGLLMLFKMKAAMLAALAMKGLAVIAFKALVIAKIALTITLIIGLKKLAEAKHHSSTYEVVAHDDHHGHFRSFGQELAYRGYKDDSNGIISS